MNYIIESMVRFRWLLLLLSIGIAAPLIPYAGKAFIPDNSINVWFLETDPLLKHYHRFQKIFGNDEVIILLLENQDGSIFDPDFFGKIKKLGQELKKLDGVDHVNSIAEVRDAFDTKEGILFKKVSEFLSSQELENHFLSAPYFKGRLVDETGKKALVWIQMDTMDNFDQHRDKVVAEVDETIKGIFQTALPWGGIGIIYSALNRLTEQDLGTVVGAGYGIMLLILGITFRSFRFVLATIAIIGLSTIITLGLLNLAGSQVNMVTVVLPTVIMVLGVADAIHFPSTFYRLKSEFPDLDKKQITIKAMHIILLPCLLTSLTTAVGFLSLANAPMTAVRELGIYASIGILLAYIFSLILMAVYFSSKKQDSSPPRDSTILIPFLTQIEKYVRNYSNSLFLIFMILFSVGSYLALNLNSDTFTMGYLPKDSRTYQNHNYLEAEWGYYQPFEFTLEKKSNDYIEDAKTLNLISEFTKQVAQLPEINRYFSLLDLYKRTGSIMSIDTSGSWSDDTVAQLKFVLDSQNLIWDRSEDNFHDNVLAPLINEDRDILRITFTTKMLSSNGSRELNERILSIGKTIFQEDYLLTPSGYLPLYTKIVDYTLSSQVSSFGIALTSIFILMIIWLRSLRLALISIVPNLFPIVCMFAAMKIMNISLDIATATIAAIVMGVAVDDTIHFLYHWRKGELSGLSWEECLKYTYSHAGKAALVTSFVLMLSYPVLILAQVKTVQYFGILTSFSAFTALIGDLFLLPSLLKFFHRPNSPS